MTKKFTPAVEQTQDDNWIKEQLRLSVTAAFNEYRTKNTNAIYRSLQKTDTGGTNVFMNTLNTETYLIALGPSNLSEETSYRMRSFWAQAL